MASGAQRNKNVRPHAGARSRCGWISFVCRCCNHWIL